MESNLVLYSNENTKVTINVTYHNENFWLTQKAMAQLFGVEVPAISKHLSNIYEDFELIKDSTISILEIVQIEGNRSVKRKMEFYNLDAIIAVGYRVNSKQATQFRIWATHSLKELIIKGFVLNDEMLKNGRAFGKDYFEELLERIREIRASERRVNQKLGDVFQQCSADYQKDSEEAKLFYKMVQNKLHFAITGQTAAEIIYNRADQQKENMGLTTWKNAPKGKILKSDVFIAKNYLKENEIGDLNLLVSAFLDLAEFQARRKQTMNMNDWLERTNKFLESNSLDVLPNAGKISHDEAIDKAHSAYEIFRIEQDKKYISDLDEVINKMGRGK
ncbi:MAG: virulence RhuM family protein [Crocinitomicaceae bacterium]|jgi:hypothetical protein|nr:virulence RhuM family protein [Crocinitomicaceae bacterium]MCF8411139.1 virulence RhuM family protein [Crocinitomicaceae bacterium]